MRMTARTEKNKIPWVNSIRGKLTLTFIGLSVLILGLAGGIAYERSQTSLQTAVQTSLTNQVNTIAVFVDDWIIQRKNDMVTLSNVSRIRSLEAGKSKEAIDQYAAQWGIYETIFLTDANGITITTSDNSQMDLSQRPYFLEVKQNKVVVANPLISKATGTLVFVVAAPVFALDKPDEIIGMIGGTLPTAALDPVLSTVTLGKSGEALITNSDGYFITPARFPEKLKAANLIKERAELELKLDSNLILQALNGIRTKDYFGNEIIGSAASIASTGWTVIAKQDTNEAFATVYSIRNLLLIIFAVVLVLAISVSIFIARSIAAPIHQMVLSAEALAVGNVNQEIDYSGKDEIGNLADSFRTVIIYQREMALAAEKIARGDLSFDVLPASTDDRLGIAFSSMVKNLREKLNQINQNAQELKNSSENLSALATQAGNATTQIALTVQQIATGITSQSESVSRTTRPVELLSRTIESVAKGAQEQARAITKTSELSNDLGVAIKQVSSNAEEVSNGSVSARGAALNGRGTIEETIQGMETIRAKVELSSQKISEMDQRSNQIGMIVETIEEIATQTNLLALNAAIEAARAGEHGKGFAVVAEEVRKLAERSSLSTHEIGSLVKDIQTTVSEAVMAMQESANEVRLGVNHANTAGEALDKILKAIELVTAQAQQASEAASLMDVSSMNMTQAVESVSAVIEENTAATEEMAAGSQEITASIENIAAISEENSAAVEQVSASAEQMSAQAEAVSMAANSLAAMAKRLDEVVTAFKLS